ncbi:hypothetical protein J3R30DRAFT_3414060 [Lentinula aciculospora]|uniref:Uncharacterized protein n=1 Tax=Lentinula aciculospora TaxID=153920 RepID=A0A9W9DE14_9AGAR|nr:hypothetical protein J3R30DRAFT_3414060 [Lentinula aciculospora]
MTPEELRTLANRYEKLFPADITQSTPKAETTPEERTTIHGILKTLFETGKLDRTLDTKSEPPSFNQLSKVERSNSDKNLFKLRFLAGPLRQTYYAFVRVDKKMGFVFRYWSEMIIVASNI